MLLLREIIYSSLDSPLIFYDYIRNFSDGIARKSDFFHIYFFFKSLYFAGDNFKTSLYEFSAPLIKILELCLNPIVLLILY